MKVEVRRYTTLANPQAGRVPGEPESVDLDDRATVAQLLERLALPPESVHLVVVDGRILHDRNAVLADGCRVALFPPVGGG
jgi:molybdopterin converting factor small subunit